MKKKIVALIGIFTLVLCSLFGGFKVSASPSHYDLTITNNALVFTFPDYHASFSKEFIGINGEEIVSRLDNSLLINNELGVIDIYKYIWAWYFDFRIIGEEDYIVELRVYNLLATEYRTQNFNFIGQYEIPVSTTNVILSIDYDSTLETFVNFEFDGSNIKQYLEYNGLQPGYSALGDMLDNYYNSGFSAGFDSGINEQLSNQNWWVELWDGVDAFLSVELLPNLTFGLLFSVPLVFGVLHLILFIWRSGD